DQFLDGIWPRILVRSLQRHAHSVHFVTDRSSSFTLWSTPMPLTHVPTAREQAFLDTVEDSRYEREIINGLAPFFNEKAPQDMMNFYSPAEVVQLRVLKGTDR